MENPENKSSRVPAVSIIIPTYNGAQRIGRCLDALQAQAGVQAAEILVVDDGSTDDTVKLLRCRAGVRLIEQANAGPASARNHGARQAHGWLILFTDDDCEPAEGWLEAMVLPFAQPGVVGAKGIYRTRQPELVARFVQAEYEDKYRYMAGFPTIDFIDTYSAAYVRERFVEMQGYDTAFPVACAEDIELSYRMSARGWKMVFAPEAIVYHQHPNALMRYLKKKFKFAFWRVLAVRKNPGKGAKDSHTPQLMKLQLLLCPALLAGLMSDLAFRPVVSITGLVLVGFLVTTLPFAVRTAQRDLAVGMLAPAFLAMRAFAQFFGVVLGVVSASRMVHKANVPAR